MINNPNPLFIPWQIQEEDFPYNGSSAEKFKFLLRYAILAPSGHNTQPWKFSIQEDNIMIFIDTSRWLKVADPNKQTLHISIGCAIENLLISAENFGYKYSIAYFPDSNKEDLVATVRLEQKAKSHSLEKTDLFNWITKRYTNRKVYDNRVIPSRNIAVLKKCIHENDITLDIIDNFKKKREIANWLISGHTSQSAKSDFRKESAKWLGGIGLVNLPSPIIKMVQLILPHLNPPKKIISFMDSRLVMSAAAIAILSSKKDDKESQVKIGQAFERIFLTARSLNLNIHPMIPIVDIPELRAKVVKLLPETSVIPQQAFRLGYAEEKNIHTPRRSLEEVLI